MPTLRETIENTCIDAIKVAMNGKLRIVEDAPPMWSKDMALRALKATPAAYVAYTGGRNGSPGGDDTTFNASFSVIAATDHASGSRAQRRGDSRDVGMWEIVETICPILDGKCVDEVGTIQYLGDEPVDVADWDLKGLFLWEMQFLIPNIVMPKPYDPALLQPFNTFHPEYDLAPADGTREATDDITIPQD